MKKKLEVFENWGFNVALRKQVDLEDIIQWARKPLPEHKDVAPLPASKMNRWTLKRLVRSVLP